MRVVIQRVSHAKVEVAGAAKGEIGLGLLLLVGVEDQDEDEDVDYLVRKITAMRIFKDDEGKMNLSLMEIGGEFLVISQFTLHASTKKGNRPSFIKAAAPEKAERLYERFKTQLKALSDLKVESGEFGANMQVSLLNDGPVTIVMDSKNKE